MKEDAKQVDVRQEGGRVQPGVGDEAIVYNESAPVSDSRTPG